MFHLISHEKCPPGEFWYRQTFPKGVKQWGSTPEMRALGRKVANFRTANGLPRDSFAEALEDIDQFTCNRLGNNPRYCRDTDAPFAEVHAYDIVPVKPCVTCGAKL